ncbi:MAG: cytidylate kinase-like family protein [Desulfobacterales bacterium]|nr:cytidylate kinase-like family protein [Desulfobacterales bacterium]
MKSIQQIIEDQARKWQMSQGRERKPVISISNITISREPGSGGRLVAEGLADKLSYDLFHQEMINEMAQSAKISRRILETLDEKGLSIIEDWIASLVHQRHLWPDQYLQHLMKVVGALGKHGRAVLVGRGANFILPQDQTLRVRVVAPQKTRIANVAGNFNVSLEDAKMRVLQTEADRKAFIRKYFHADIAAPINYDLVINTGQLTIEAAVEAIQSCIDAQMRHRTQKAAA